MVALYFDILSRGEFLEEKGINRNYVNSGTEQQLLNYYLISLLSK